MSGALPGLGIGAGIGTGLGALFSKLSGKGGYGLTMPLGGITGGLLGAATGNLISQGVNYRNNKNSYGQLNNNSRQDILNAFAQDMDMYSGTTEFTQWAAQDPVGFEQFMLKHV